MHGFVWPFGSMTITDNMVLFSAFHLTVCLCLIGVTMFPFGISTLRVGRSMPCAPGTSHFVHVASELIISAKTMTPSESLVYTPVLWFGHHSKQ